MFFAKKYALVLAGGGAKGVYQLGAWKALRELRITAEAIVGSSVGALNGAFIAQGAYQKAVELWESMTIDKIISLPREFVDRGGLSLKPGSLSFLKKIKSELIDKGGFDTSPLKKIIADAVDEDAIRKSGVDFGIAAYDMTDWKAKELFLESIPTGQLKEYLLGSSSLPGFKKTKIEGKDFIDGGVFNNIPYQMMKDRGYKRIIIIDVSGLGMNKKPDIEGTQTVYIKNSIDMGHILDFSPEFLHDFRELGYLDTLKVFEKLDGIRYFYREDKRLTAALEEVFYSDPVADKIIDELSRKGIKVSKAKLTSKIRELLPQEMRNYRYVTTAMAECAAGTLEVQPIRLYQHKDFIQQVRQGFLDHQGRIVRRQYRNILEQLLGMMNENNYLAASLFSIVLQAYDNHK